MGLFNPYSYIGAAIVLASVGGTFYYQNTQIHHYHTLDDADKVTITQLQDKIKHMTVVQDTQSRRSEENVAAVTAPPTTIVKIIEDNKKEPLPSNCATPAMPKELEPYE